MTVRPLGLDGVAAYDLPRPQNETALVIRNIRPDDIAHDIGLAAARRTRTGAAEKLHRKIALYPVVPRDGEHAADELDVRWNQHCGHETIL